MYADPSSRAGSPAHDRPAPAAPGALYRATARLTLRSGPSSLRRTLLDLPAGAAVRAVGQTAGAWLRVVHDRTVGWAHRDGLSAEGADGDRPVPVLTTAFLGTAVAAASVDLRADPAPGARVLRAVPPGAAVAVAVDLRHGFRFVVHE